MKKMKSKLCDSCLWHFIVAGVDCCGKCAPNWDVVDGEFTCEDYRKKKEIEDEKKNAR